MVGKRVVSYFTTGSSEGGRGEEACCSEQHRTCSAGFSPSRESTGSAPSKGLKPVQDTINLFSVRFITASALALMQLKALYVTFTAPC